MENFAYKAIQCFWGKEPSWLYVRGFCHGVLMATDGDVSSDFLMLRDIAAQFERDEINNVHA